LSTENLTEFSLRLKKAREQAGMSKSELARRAAVSAAYIGQLEGMAENSKKKPSDLLMDRLAQELGVNSAWLKNNKGEMHRNKFQEFSATREEEMAEEKVMHQVIAEAQGLHAPGTIKLTFFEEALFHMIQDLPEEARKRIQKDIIMEWVAAKQKNP
jgi:transcriptional regulator with XRE-family HTH domain